MKKLKIFLLLSILLCFGFVLRSEVHAQGDGPKTLEINDVLPDPTTLPTGIGYGCAFNHDGTRLAVAHYSSPYITIYDTTTTPYTKLQNPTTLPTDTGNGCAFNHDGTRLAVAHDNSPFITAYRVSPLSYAPKPFEEGDVLPAGNIKISWDFTGKPVDVLHIFSILGDSEGDEVLNIEISSYGDSGSIIIIFINDNEFFVNEPGGTILTLTEPITIHSVEGYETYDYEPLDYYEYIDDALLWEVVSQDYTDGYEDGYAYAGVSYELGREHAREIYGYFDPITNQWLSVSEYLELYGTDKPGQSDFYANFDKYFIPAMIIVFGGAIVLTILKVFKGRE